MSWTAGCADPNLPWVAIGLFGQGLFFTRFFFQWLASERLKRSVIPDAFWYISLSGAAIVLAYGIHRMDPVIMLSQVGGIIFYCRNIYLIMQHKRSRQGQATAESAG
jgi:lipid-A-disaccharide synthase-like uncharacterized protein